MKQRIWNLPVPLDERVLLRDEPDPTLVQFVGGTAPAARDHRILGDFLAERPDTEVRFYGAHLTPDLVGLSAYASAHRVTIDVDGVTSFEPLRALRPDLVALTLGRSSARRISLAPLRRFGAIRELTLVGHQADIATVARLRTLERLSLISLKLPSLDLFEPLAELRAFELKLGGTTDLRALPRIGRLRYLEVWRVNGLTDLSVIADLADLEYLFLQHLTRVEVLPRLASCHRLRRVHLDRVAIRDLAPIAAAPALEELLLLDMPQLEPDAFRPLRHHPALRSVTAGIHNEARRAAVRELLGLHDVQSLGTDFQFVTSDAAV